MPRGLSSIAGESEEGSSETLTRKTTQEKKTVSTNPFSPCSP